MACGFPLAPFILGVILGDQIEINLVRSIMTDSDVAATGGQVEADF